MKIIGILAVGFSVSLFGFFLTSTLIKINKQFEKIIEITEVIKTKMQYSNSVLPEIIEALVKNSDYNFLFLPIEGDLDDYFYKICFKNSGLLISSTAKKELYNFLNLLGKTDLENQLLLFENYSKIFRRFSDEINEKNKSKIKIYPSLSILGGLFVAMLLF